MTYHYTTELQQVPSGLVYWKYRIYVHWLSYPSKHWYVKSTDHETYDKIAMITGAILGLMSN